MVAVQPNLAILVGSAGRGTNMATLIAACLSGYVSARPVLVISPRHATPAVLRAQALGVRVEVVAKKGPDYAAKLLTALREARADWVCLAGYMYLLPEEVLVEFPDRVLNIHPALLPKFGGKGMYGIRVHEAVLAAGERESGCTVHYVNDRYDEGEVILQKRCPVLEGDTPETLSHRVLDLEHEAYPEALRMVLERHA